MEDYNDRMRDIKNKSDNLRNDFRILLIKMQMKSNIMNQTIPSDDVIYVKI
jgi:hypothetical protein